MKTEGAKRADREKAKPITATEANQIAAEVRREDELATARSTRQKAKALLARVWPEIREAAATGREVLYFGEYDSDDQPVLQLVAAALEATPHCFKAQVQRHQTCSYKFCIRISFEDDNDDDD